MYYNFSLVLLFSFNFLCLQENVFIDIFLNECVLPNY